MQTLTREVDKKKSQFRRKGGAISAIARKAARDGRTATLQKHLPAGSNYRASRQRKGKVLPAQILEEASELADVKCARCAPRAISLVMKKRL